MPNKENIKTWVDALRSGEYEQAKHALRVSRGDGKYAYCCLGVACELAFRAKVIPPPERLGDSSDQEYVGQSWEYDGEPERLPKSVMEWLGIEDNDPTYTYYDDEDEMESVTALTEMNDELAWSFMRIADAIEEMYL